MTTLHRFGVHAAVLVLAIVVSGYASVDRHLPSSLLLRLGAVDAQSLMLGQGGQVGEVSLGRAGAIVTPVDVPTAAVPSHRPYSYTTGPKDSVESIAARYGLAPSQVLWSNPQLFGGALAAGTQLWLPPVPGVVVTLEPGDSLTSVAALFHADAQAVADFNYVRDPAALGPGVRLVVPGAGGDVDSIDHFPFGQCTWYVASRRWVPWYGDAGTWLASARAAGWATGSTPRPGAIMASWENPALGHVALVESVNSDGSWVVAEMNYASPGVIDRRTVHPGEIPVAGFIY